MTIKKVTDLDNEFTQFQQESGQHRAEVNERLNKVSTEVGTLKQELGAVRSDLSETMKVLSTLKLSNDQSSPKGDSSGAYIAVNAGPKRSTLQFDDLGFPIPPLKEQPEGSNRGGKGPVNETSFADYAQFEESDTLLQLKMPLLDGEDSHGWIYKVERYFEVQDIQPREQPRAAVLCMEGQALSWFRWSEARSPFRSWDGLKRRLLERFQLSQEGTLYEQFLAITQEGSAREYANLFETLAGQLVGIPEEVMEGAFIKGLRPELRSAVRAVRVMQPEGLNHAMKLAMIIDENKAHSTSQVAVPSKGQTTIKGEHFRRMTESELEERRAKGLCFRCEEKFKPGHQCAPHTLQVMIVDDVDEDNEPYLQVKPWDRALEAN
nr:ankyrin repeat-containing protein [Tanacetum cinerariifolium]